MSFLTTSREYCTVFFVLQNLPAMKTQVRGIFLKDLNESQEFNNTAGEFHSIFLYDNSIYKP